jgi:4-alpha-glucanotransferase
MNGKWVKQPGDAFLKRLERSWASYPSWRKTLGVITPEVEALRDKYEFPGMKVLQFAFGSDPGNPFLPFNYPRNAVVYTGTHDNDTTVGWFNSANDYEKQNLLLYLGCVSSEGIHWDLIRLALSSIANQAIIPLQDILGLGNEARMNFPSVAEGNWGWRYQAAALRDELRDRLKVLTRLNGRAPEGQ